MLSNFILPIDVKSNLVPKNLIDSSQLLYSDDFSIDATLSTSKSIDNSVIKEIYSIIENLHGIHFSTLGQIKEAFLENSSDLLELLSSITRRHLLLGSKIHFGANNKKGVVCTNKLEQNYNNYNSKLVFAGVQRHLNSSTTEINEINENSPRIIGLGSLLGKINTLEPYIRDSDYLVIDLNVISSTEINDPNGSPVGLSIMDICKIAKYAGLSYNNKYLNLIFPSITHPAQAKTIALIVWYYLEGVSFCKKDKSDVNNSTSYIVNSKNLDIELEFRKNNITNKWWLKDPTKDNEFIACIYDDYLAACNEDTSDRVLELLERI